MRVIFSHLVVWYRIHEENVAYVIIVVVYILYLEEYYNFHLS
jgi:hypothetical protein